MGQSDVQRATAVLLAPSGAIGVPIPAYGGRSLPNVTSTVVQSLGIEVNGEPSLAPPLAPELDPFTGRRAEGPVVVLLVDALGWVPPPAPGERAGNGYPPEWNDRARPITTVFPTTTTVALTSLSAAEPPGRHGVVGHRLYLPAYGAVTEILRMSPVGVAAGDAFAGPEWSPSMVSGVPSVFRRGVPAVALSRDRFEPTAFTRMIYDGASFTGYSTASDFAHQLANLLGRAEPPRLIYAYWDDLDTVQHLRGPRPEFAAFEAALVAQVLGAAARQVDAKLARRTTVIVTSDHGQVPALPAHEVAIDREPEILRNLSRPPTGDRRAAFLSARSGRLDALEEALARRLPAGHRILPMRAAVEAGLFGPPPYHPELFDRLGDLLVLVPSPAGLTYRFPGAPSRSRYLIGAHGGLEPAELLVPLVAGRLSELA
jgi:Type I phosphodiesterase / nucleotide pyrophosphatase